MPFVRMTSQTASLTLISLLFQTLVFIVFCSVAPGFSGSEYLKPHVPY